MDSWSCSLCTFKNNLLLPHCEICDSLRDPSTPAGQSNNSSVMCNAKPSATTSVSSIAQNVNFHHFICDGIMASIQETFSHELSKKRGAISTFRLSYPVCNHYSQKGSHGARWSCGYRNIQMVSSSLMQLPEYRFDLMKASCAIHQNKGQSFIISSGRSCLMAAATCPV